MKRRLHSVSFKLFGVTSLVFIGWLTAMMALQLAFFEPYYVKKKTDAFVSEFTMLREKFLSTSPAGKTVPDYFNIMESKFYALSAVVEFTENGIAVSASKKVGDTKKFIGVMPNPMNPNPGIGPVIQPMQDVDLTKLISAVREWTQDTSSVKMVLEQGQTVTRYSEVALPAGAGTKQLMVIAPLRTENGLGTVLISTASLQPVGDALEAFKGFFPYFYLLAAVGAVLLVLLYSRMITRPLRLLNGTAMRLAKLDFRARSTVRSGDEIGNLSDTLNFLSDNLQHALAELHSANAKLQEDIEKEKRLDRLRREFVAGVSHELKTPVSLIGGYAEALRDNVGDGLKRERYADVILEETARMADMVNDMLDLSQLEAGQYRLRLEPFRLEEAVAGVASKLQDHADGNTGPARPRIEVETVPALVLADRFRIEQVLANLLGNALRHTREGGRLGVRVALGVAPDGRVRGAGEGVAPDGRVRGAGESVAPGGRVGGAGEGVAPGGREHESHSGRGVKVTVWNQGDPIPEEELDAIWNHFYRVEKSRHRDSGGTGIGLAIVKQILLLHGACFSVRNTADGVEFEFTLMLEMD